MIDQAIEAQLESRTPQELAGAWRALCGMMLVYSAIAVRKKRISRNDDAYQKKAASAWLAGKGGVITFPECCAVLEMNAGRAKQAIREFAPRRVPRPINRAHTGG